MKLDDYIIIDSRSYLNFLHFSWYSSLYGMSVHRDLTIVIMCYFLAMGLAYTRSVKKYALRLFIWALIAQIPFSLLNGFHMNVLFTLLATLLILFVSDRYGNLYGGMALAAFFPFFLFCDWSILATAFALVIYLTRKKEKLYLSIFWLPAIYLVLWTILYTETEAEYVLGTLSILCSAIIIFLFAKHVDQGKQVLSLDGSSMLITLFIYLQSGL